MKKGSHECADRGIYLRKILSKERAKNGKMGLLI